MDLTQDKVKEYLHPKHHDSYDAAVAQVEAELRGRNNVEVNRRWREQQHLPPAQTKGFGGNERHPAFGRPGHTDPVERLKDMDTDGVEASSSYCEVSAFRYLYLIKDGLAEATRAFNTALAEFAVGRPEAPDRLLPDPDPRHRRRGRRGAVGGGRGLQVAAAARVPGRARPARLLGRALRPAVGGDPGADLPICCHIGLNTELEDLARRDPTPQRAIFVPMVAAVDGRGLRHVDADRRARALPRPEGGVRRAGHRLGRVVAVHRRRHGDAPGVRVPGHQAAAQRLLPPQHHLTFIDEPNVIRHAHERLGIHNVMWSSDYPHPVSSWPELRNRRSNVSSPVSQPEDRSLVCYANAARVWNL